MSQRNRIRSRLLSMAVVVMLVALTSAPLAAKDTDIDHPARAVARFLYLSEEQRPDPTAIGNLLLAIRSLRSEIQAAVERGAEDFEALLGVEQARRLGAVRRAAHLSGVVPAFRQLHLL